MRIKSFSSSACCLRADWSYYPSVAPGSTFIGFTVANSSVLTLRSAVTTPTRKWQAVLWGKSPAYMQLQQNAPLLKAISEHIDILATVDIGTSTELEVWGPELAAIVENRGVLDTVAYVQLLQQSALLIGVGQPFYGNAALDALQQGMMVSATAWTYTSILSNAATY